MGGSGSKSVYAGTKYYIGMHMVLCYGPIDAVTAFTADGKELWSGTNTGGNIYIDKPDIWGGEKREGGVVGNVDVDMGHSNQLPNEYLDSVIDGNIPAFRDVVSVVWKRLYYAMNPYIKPWGIRCKRTQILNSGEAQWNSTKSNIDGDLNPAHIVRECITDPTWGMGYTSANIDNDSFTAAAATLYTEGFGLSFLLETESPIEDFITEVMAHISGRLFVEPTTGKFHLTLVRDDYDINTIPTFDESNVLELEEFERKGWSETVNAVNVIFTNRDTAQGETVVVHDIANIQRQGSVVSQTNNYLGITKGELALRVATRDLSILSKSLSKLKIKVNKDAFNIAAGDVFKFTWDSYGLGGIAYRILDIDYGSFDKGTITISAIEDSFGLPTSVYTEQQPSGWVPPEYPALDPTRIKAIEAPYIWVTTYVSEADLNTLASDFAVALALVGSPGSGHYYYDLFTKTSADSVYEFGVGGSFASTAEVAVTGLVKEITSTVYYASDEGVVEEDTLVDTYAYIGNEMVGIVSINKTNKSMVVDRGLFDTVPEVHAVGTVIYFAERYEESDEEEYTIGETVNMKALTVTNQGRLSEGSATTFSKTMNGRFHKPYPPGNLKVNGFVYPLGLTTAGNDALTWSHRDRLLQTVYFNKQNEADIGPEAGTTYTVKIYAENGGLLRTVSGLAGTSYTYDLADELADSGNSFVENTIKYIISAQRDGYDSYQSQVLEFTRPNQVVAVAETNYAQTIAFLDNTVYIPVLLPTNNAETVIVADFTTTNINASVVATTNHAETLIDIPTQSGGSIVAENLVGEDAVGG